MTVMGDVDPYVAERYEVTKRLGKGAYGIVWKALDKKNGKTVAVKKIYDAFRNRTDAQRTFREIWFLQEFSSHPNIIKLYEVVKAKNDKDIYLIFEFMALDLHHFIKRPCQKEEWQYQYIIYQLLSALAYIHSACVIHRDIKPSNILLNEKYHLKLADFGLARSLEQGDECPTDPALTEYVATRWYRAPEILLGSKRYTRGVDIWSVGCIMGEMIGGKPLFPGTSTLNQMERVMAALPHPSQSDIESLCTGYAAYVMERAANKPKRLLENLVPQCSNDALDLLSKLLTLNPSRRITAKDGVNHPYVSGFKDKELNSQAVKAIPPLSDHTKLSINQYRDKLYEMIGDSVKMESPVPSSESCAGSDFSGKINEKRVIVKQRSCDSVPSLNKPYQSVEQHQNILKGKSERTRCKERKEALLKNQIAKKQPLAPMARTSLTPPFLSERGKFSLGFKHPVILRGPDTTTTTPSSEESSVITVKKTPSKYGRRQFANASNQSYCSSAKSSLQSYSQGEVYGTITASALRALKEGRW